jgi:ribose transport system ATP-binding protein
LTAAQPVHGEGPVLRVEGIRKSFGGIEVLHGIDLDVTGGRVVALLGENGAGKSTLVKIMSGDYQPDDGVVMVGGTMHRRLNPVSARSLGIRMIYQELNDAATLTVAENVMLGRLPRTAGFVRWREVWSRARAILDELEVDIDPRAPMSSLRVGERQIVEIARALLDDARVLVLDEPTAALSEQEVRRLFDFIGRLRERGTAMIYITHRLDEVGEVADDVAVLRDGNVVLREQVGQQSRSELVRAMVGATVQDVVRPEIRHGGRPVLEIAGAASGRSFRDIDLEVRAGEIVGLYGKIGSGIAEVAEATFGLRALTAGTVRFEDRPGPAHPRAAIRNGIGFLPPDRKREAAFLQLSSARNLTAPTWGREAAGGVWLTAATERSAFEQWRQTLGIRVSPSGAHRPLALLSGGNQQKVMLARWLHARSRLLVLVEPTRGVDVGARHEIYTTLRELAGADIAVLVASSDHEEIVQVTDRAVVMARGRIVEEIGGEDVTSHALTDAAGG